MGDITRKIGGWGGGGGGWMGGVWGIRGGVFDGGRNKEEKVMWEKRKKLFWIKDKKKIGLE